MFVSLLVQNINLTLETFHTFYHLIASLVVSSLTFFFIVNPQNLQVCFLLKEQTVPIFIGTAQK